MAKASKLVAYQFKPGDFEYVLLADVLALQKHEKKPQFTVEIHIGSKGPYVDLSDKTLTGVVPGDWIRWECSRPFRLKFHNGKGPGGPGEPTEFNSKPVAGLEVCTLNISKLAGDVLNYDINVEVEPGRWALADPSIIIDTTLNRIFVPKLKDDVAFPPLAMARKAVKASTAKRGGKAGGGKRSTQPAKAPPVAKGKPVAKPAKRSKPTKNRKK